MTFHPTPPKRIMIKIQMHTFSTVCCRGEIETAYVPTGVLLPVEFTQGLVDFKHETKAKTKRQTLKRPIVSDGP